MIYLVAPSMSYWNAVLGGDYYDSTHPNDSGHAKMAAIWYQAFKNAYSYDLLTVPAQIAAVDDNSPASSGDDSNTFTSASLPAAP